MRRHRCGACEETMKINAIKALCMEARHCILYGDERKGQWIGTRRAVYPVEGMTLRKESIPALFDLTEKQMDRMTMEEAPLGDCPLVPQPQLMPEEMTQCEVGLSNLGGVECLMQGDTVYMLEKRLLSAAVGAGEYRRFSLTRNAMDEEVILIDDGMVTVALAYPMKKEQTEKMQEEMRKVVHAMAGGRERPPIMEAGGPPEEEQDPEGKAPPW